MSSQNKVVLIAGGSSGIGAATARLYAQRGYKIAIVGSNKSKVAKVVKECDEQSSIKQKTLSLTKDLSNLKNCDAAVEETIAYFGRIDILVNSLGIVKMASILDYKAYQESMAINLDSVVKITLCAVEHLKKTNGSIIFVSSMAALRPEEYAAAYAISKAGLNTFAVCLAKELAKQVRVNVVSPGAVSTPMLWNSISGKKEAAEEQYKDLSMLGRVGQPEEIAEAIYYLTSDVASFIHGSQLVIDGGCQWKI